MPKMFTQRTKTTERYFGVRGEVKISTPAIGSAERQQLHRRNRFPSGLFNHQSSVHYAELPARFVGGDSDRIAKRGEFMGDVTTWPQKTRELHGHHFDSTIWNEFKFRDNDIIIATYAKSGTTWMQQIIAQLIFKDNPRLEVAEMSPWLDLRVPPKAVKLPMVESQTHRRFLKTHLPVDALVFSPKAKYLYIGRDGRDVVWSLYNHHANANQLWYDALNKTPGLVGPPILPPPADILQYWRHWFERDGYPFWSFWESVRTWWNIRNVPNVMLVHYADLKRDMTAEMRRIAGFLDIPIDESNWPAIVEYCSFDWMKKNAVKSVPLGGAFWDAGAEVFINKGINGRWSQTLTTEESAAYEARAVSELGRECAKWLAMGRMAMCDD